MKLSQLLTSGKILPASKNKVKLSKKITTDDGKVFKKGTQGTLVLDFGNGEYHFENNSGAFRIKSSEFERID